MKENNHVVSEEQIKSIKSIKDEAALQLATEAEDGVNPYYHTIGTMGGLSVRDKYSSVESMRNQDRVSDSNSNS